MSEFSPIAHINLDALRHNLQRVRELAPGNPIMAVVKANAYGHGAERIAKALSQAGVSNLAVARFGEAIALRDAGITTPITVLEGVYSVDDLKQAVASNIHIVLHDPTQIETLLVAPSIASQTKIWLKLETGMNRLGLLPHEASHYSTLISNTSWCRELGYMTHMASADEPDNSKTQNQLRRFNEFINTAMPGVTRTSDLLSTANSACICAWPEAHKGWLRPGIMIYGGSPLANRSAAELGLKPVMSLRSRILSVHDVPKGLAVGYGANWQATRNSRIAIAAAGYADGYPRSLPSGTTVAVAGTSGRLVGRVSMDKIAIDITDCQLAGQAPIKTGDPVELWGNEVPVDTVAKNAGTISYELLSQVTQRVRRVFGSPS